MRTALLALLNEGEYQYTLSAKDLKQVKTRGLWQGEMIITLPGYETIHGNTLTITFEWLQVGATKHVIAEDVYFTAHGRTTKIDNHLFWEELRKHI